MFSTDKIFVICELSQTHEGKLDLAKRLVQAAADAKADAVKFQVFTADELAVPAYKHFNLFTKLEWPKETWKELIDMAHSLGLKAMADVFGISSARMLSSIGIDAIKIHDIAVMDLPLLLSTGGTYLDELKDALNILNPAGKSGRSIVLMHGFQSYPTLIEHTNLLKMKYFGERLSLPYGFADHIDGDHCQNFSLCAMAVGMGACVIEKHITIDRALKMEDYESALNPSSFKEFVEKMRELQAAKGKAADELLAVEKEYRKSTRKHVAALSDLAKGKIVSASDVALKRAVSDAEPADLENIIGKTLKRNISRHEAILEKDLT